MLPGRLGVDQEGRDSSHLLKKKLLFAIEAFANSKRRHLQTTKSMALFPCSGSAVIL
jgi:hypothetical protein